MDIHMQPIGWIHTPFKARTDLALPPCHPEAPYHDPEVTGKIIMEPEFCAGIKDITPGSFGLLLFYFDRSKDYKLITRSHGQNRDNVGVFSTRSPHRPNGIGVTVVKFLRVDGCEIEFQGVDMLDQTPLLDIKPYVPESSHQ